MLELCCIQTMKFCLDTRKNETDPQVWTWKGNYNIPWSKSMGMCSFRATFTSSRSTLLHVPFYTSFCNQLSSSQMCSYTQKKKSTNDAQPNPRQGARGGWILLYRLCYVNCLNKSAWSRFFHFQVKNNLIKITSGACWPLEKRLHGFSLITSIKYTFFVSTIPFLGHVKALTLKRKFFLPQCRGISRDREMWSYSGIAKNDLKSSGLKIPQSGGLFTGALFVFCQTLHLQAATLPPSPSQRGYSGFFSHRRLLCFSSLQPWDLQALRFPTESHSGEQPLQKPHFLLPAIMGTRGDAALLCLEGPINN